MNKNSLITLLTVGLIVIAGIALFLNNNQISPLPASSPETTPSAEKKSATDTASSLPQAGMPIILTDSGAAVSNSAAVVNGKVTPNGAQTSYWYDYGKTTSLDTRTSPQYIGSGFIQIPAPAYISGLSPNTVYYFRLSAQNSLGTVNGLMYSFTTNTQPPPRANAPTTRTESATDISRTGANLHGSVNPNNSPTTSWFEYGETSELGNVASFQSTGNQDNLIGVSVSVSNLKPLTKYYFRLNAQNQYGTANGAILNFTTKGPPNATAPGVQTDGATEITSTSATLNGRVDPNGADTDYWFEYGHDSLLTLITNTTKAKRVPGNGFDPVHVEDTITGLSTSTKYFYRLVANNAHGTVRGDIETFQTRK